MMGTRNSVDDVLYTAKNATNFKGKECGNGLVIRHEYGWETQYCHMKKGSVQVKTGEILMATSHAANLTKTPFGTNHCPTAQVPFYMLRLQIMLPHLEM